MTKDPVCGMQVDEKTAALRAEHQGKQFFFCSAGCQSKFKQNPGAYAGKG